MKGIKYSLIFLALSSFLTGCQQHKQNKENSSNIEYSQQSEHTYSYSSMDEKEVSEELVPLINLGLATMTLEKESVSAINSVATSDIKNKVDGKTPIKPLDYQKILGKGMDVDWSKTSQGRKYYNEQTVIEFKKAGISHVRIRVKDKADEALFQYLDQQIDDCLKHGLIPIIAYQADEFKNKPTQKNIDKVVKWWGDVAKRYKDKSFLLSFDLLIEATDALNKQPEKLNDIYEQLVTEIRKTNPKRIIMMSPRLRSDATYLSELKVPTNHNYYMMAEWHFYAAGPSKTTERKLWTIGTKEEKDKILDKIKIALEWQKETGIPTWVGAWMPGNYNEGNDYTIKEQVAFAQFMTESLIEGNIPFAVNSDTKFYNRKTNQWIKEMQPVFRAIYE